MEKLLPDILKDLWHTVDENHFTVEQFYFEQERLLDDYRRTWKQALVLEGHQDLKESLLGELGSYLGCEDLAEVERHCMHGSKNLEDEWHDRVDPTDKQSIEEFYDKSQPALYELVWWHTLCEDNSPLAYVTALHFALQHGSRRCLDFGSGVGSGAILFARHGFEVALADISSPMLRFSQWRFGLRGLRAQFMNLKSRTLPSKAFDFVSAMDVFEHLVDPVATVDKLAEALRPGGFLFGRFNVEADDDRGQHIVHDFAPVFQRLQELGFVQVWQDEWLWGHQVFQKRLSH